MSDFDSSGLDNGLTAPRDNAEEADLNEPPSVKRKSLFGGCLTVQRFPDLFDTYTPRPTIKLTLGDQAVLDSIDIVCIERASRTMGTLPRGVHDVLESNPLPMCAKLNVTQVCNCTELTHWVSDVFQKDIRKTYAEVVKMSNIKFANEYLKSFMLRRRMHDKGRFFWQWFLYVPCFIDSDKCRVFIVCPTTFQKLFGISKAKFFKLRSDKQKEYDKYQEQSPFRFEEYDTQECFYRVGRFVYKCEAIDTDWLEYRSVTRNQQNRQVPSEWKVENILDH